MRYGLKPDDFEKVKRKNLVAAIIYFLSGAFVFVGSLTIETVKNYKPEIFINYLERVKVTNYPLVYQLQNKTIMFIENLPVMLILGALLLISAIIHFSVITKKINPDYNNHLQKGVNKLKWIDGIFSSVIIALLPILVGVNDFGIIVLLFTLSIIFNLSAMGMEQSNANSDKPIWAPFIGIVLTFLASAAVIVFSVLRTIEAAEATIIPLLPSPFLKSMNYIIVAVYFFFMLLKIVQIFLQHKRVGKWKNPTFNESVYIILNLITKIAVVGVLFYSIVNKLIIEAYIKLL